MKIKRAYFTNGVARAADELADEAIRFTRGSGADGGVLGLSGGIDSTATAFITQYAFGREDTQEKRLQLHCVIMPSEANSLEDQEDGLRVSRILGIEAIVVPIEPIADAIASQIPIELNEFDRGNLYSEARAIVLSRIAAAKNCRIMGTGNWDEDYVLGYCTKRGDAAVDNNILGNLPKRLVRELAAWFDNPKVPEDLIKRIPTAGLWEGQTDEKELGYSYEQSEIVQRGFNQGYTSTQIKGITGFRGEIIEDVARRHETTGHKRKVPPVGKVNLSYREIK